MTNNKHCVTQTMSLNRTITMSLNRTKTWSYTLPLSVPQQGVGTPLGLSVQDRVLVAVIQQPIPPTVGSVKPINNVIQTLGPTNVNSSGSATLNVSTSSNVSAPASYTYRNVTITKLCGFPAFCSSKAFSACANTPLCACAECSKTGAGFFVFFVVLLGLACVFGNVLVMAVLKKLGLRQSFNKMKFSLAVADFLTGVQLLVVSMYNFSWTMNVSSSELDRRQLLLRGSSQATAGGIFLLLTFTSSLYHLVIMGAQRLYAIKWPLHFRNQRSYQVYIGLAAAWSLALISSTVPAWFPESLVYTYQHTIFLFYVANSSVSAHGGNYTILIAMMVCFFIIPYLAMTCGTFVTLHSVHSNMTKSKQLKHDKSANQKAKKADNKEIQICVTVALMQLGFTITIIPLIVVNVLFYGNSLTCDTASLPFMLCFYLSMSNSLVNVIVYSFRDKKFTETAHDLLAISICCKGKKDKKLESSGGTRTTTGTTVS